MNRKSHFYEEHILGIDAKHKLRELQTIGDLELDYGFCNDCVVKITAIRGRITIEIA